MPVGGVNHLRQGGHLGAAGSIDGSVLAAYDIDAASCEILSHGIEVSEVFHDPAVISAAAFTQTPMAALRVQIRNAVPTIVCLV